MTGPIIHVWAPFALWLAECQLAHLPPSKEFPWEDLAIDYATRSVTVAGQPAGLTSTEYNLLVELSTNAGRAMTQGQLLSRVWGRTLSGIPQSGPQLVRAFVRNLRRKLGDDANDPRYIFTEPRVGYRMPKGETKGTLER